MNARAEGTQSMRRFSAPMNPRMIHAISVLVLAVSLIARAAAGMPGDPPMDEHGYLRIGFDRLASYRFEPPGYDPEADPKAPPATGEEQIPESVKAWSGRKAIVTGFMMPTKLDKGLATEFLLVRDPSMCCYGITPAMNEWIVVRMGKGVRPLMDVPISFYGTLRVGAVMVNGYLMGIYEFEAERIGSVKG